MALLLNSRSIDWIFRRGSVPFRGDFLSANKQFIVPLPIRLPSKPEMETLDDLSRHLHALATQIAAERDGFLDWLGDVLGVRARQLPGATSLARHEQLDVGELLAILRRSRARLDQDPDARAFRDLLASEHRSSMERLGGLLSDQVRLEREANRAVADLYELSADQRAVVDRDYE